MSASKYLPPFTTEERGVVAGDDRSARTSADSSATRTEPEVTYADFLGDQVDEVDE